MEITGFEDEGAHRLIPLEDVGGYQFAAGSRQAGEAAVHAMREAIRQLDTMITIPADAESAAGTRRRIEEERQRAAGWLTRRGVPGPLDVGPHIDSRHGLPAAWQWLDDYFSERGPPGLAALDQRVTQAYVSNPGSGEVIKGRAHRRPIRIHRLFMSFLETEAMNGRYLEAEAILIAAPGELF